MKEENLVEILKLADEKLAQKERHLNVQIANLKAAGIKVKRKREEIAEELKKISEKNEPATKSYLRIKEAIEKSNRRNRG